MLVPAALDIIGSSTMYFALNLTDPSSFAMLQGANVVLTALLAQVTLRTRLQLFHWLGLLSIVVGLVVVALSDSVHGASASGKTADSAILGDALVLLAQVVGAIQGVYEQAVLVRYDIHPLQAGGYEGLFGVVILGVMLVPLSFVSGGSAFSYNSGSVLEDPVDAFLQLTNSFPLVAINVATILTVAILNMSGMTVSKEVNAASRVVLTQLSTLFIWLVSLALGWQNFLPLQVPGYLLLVVGSMIFHEIGFAPFLAKRGYRFFSSAESDYRYTPLASSGET